VKLSSKNIAFEKLSSDLLNFIKDNDLTSQLGAMQMTTGVFILLFSERHNKEWGVVITGTHDLPKTVQRTTEILEKNL
jgi:hypothetical protein